MNSTCVVCGETVHCIGGGCDDSGVFKNMACDRCRVVRCVRPKTNAEAALGKLDLLELRVNELLADLEAAHQALKPFAKLGNRYNERLATLTSADVEVDGEFLSTDDFRRAANVLRKHRQ